MAPHSKRSWIGVISLTIAAAILSCGSAAEAQLRMRRWRADGGQVYQVLQYQAGDDRGTGLDEIRVTSVVANSFDAQNCGTSTNPDLRFPLEALAFGPIHGSWPLAMASKSPVIADASPPCFDSSAVDGLGRVCVGPGCSSSCACPDGAPCVLFSIGDGVPLTTATPGVAGAHTVLPLRVRQRRCNVSNAATFGFGVPMQVTSVAEICSPAPSDGFRLPGTPSTFSGGTDGTTVVIAYEANMSDLVLVTAAGFGIDSDGINPNSCDAPGSVVAALQAIEDDTPTMPPPGPPIHLTADEQRCQQSVGRTGRRFLGKVLRGLQFCRSRILDGTWAIPADQCPLQPAVARGLAAAVRSARGGLRGSCRNVDIGALLTCGDSIDELFSADGTAGCLLRSHLDMAHALATSEFGF